MLADAFAFTVVVLLAIYGLYGAVKGVKTAHVPNIFGRGYVQRVQAPIRYYLGMLLYLGLGLAMVAVITASVVHGFL